MKKKKVINIRKSLAAGAIAITALIAAGLGIEYYNNKNQDQIKEPDLGISDPIIDIDDNNNYENELPGGVVIDPVDPEVIDPIIEDPAEVEISEPEQEVQEQTPTEETNQNETNTGKKNNNNKVKPTAPVVPQPVHTHTLGSWISIDDDIEGSYCPEDGELIETRAHSYSIIDSTSVSNNNGTHNTTIELSCDTCGHTTSITKSNIDCEGTLTWDENYEYELCDECGYKAIIGTHKLDEGTIKGNEIEYTCENEGCGYTETKAYNPTTPVNPSNPNDPNNENNQNNQNNENKPSKPNKPNKPGHGGGSSSNNHNHTYGPWVSIDDELEGSYCPEDGKLMDTRAHSYSETTIKSISNGNGTHNTVTSTVCDTCGHAKTTTLENIPCTFDNGIINSDQTKITYTCTECGYTKTENYNPEHKHSWNEWTITKQPTCIEAGERTRTCATCGKTEQEIIPALGHDMGAYTATQAPTCTETGIETSSCSRCDHIETRTIPALGHSYEEATNLVSNDDGTHDVVKTTTCLTCGDVQTETISSGVSCTYNNIEEVKNENGEVIQEIHSCDCGQSYTVNIDPKPEHTTHTPDAHGQYERKADDCCYETYYICSVCHEEYGITKVGHIEGEPEDGIIYCDHCGKPLRAARSIPTKEADQKLDTIIENQSQALASANATAEAQLSALIDSDANDTEIDATLNQIIADQEQAMSDANTNADQQLNGVIRTIEDASIDQIILEQDQVIASVRQNAEAKLENIISSNADDAAKDAAIDQIIEEAEKAIGEATALADAKLAALTGVVPTTNVVLELTK